MSAVPARTPGLAPIPRKSRTLRKLSLVKPMMKPIVSPIAQAIPVGVPQGRASSRTFLFVIIGMIVSGMMMLLYIIASSIRIYLIIYQYCALYF